MRRNVNTISRKDKAMFARTANRTCRINLNTYNFRGGIRL